MMEARAVAVNWGNLKFMLAASLWPSGHSLESGVPSTEQILNISSISELPGNSGLQQHTLILTSLWGKELKSSIFPLPDTPSFFLLFV